MENVTIQMEVPKDALSVAQQVLQTLVDAINSVQNQVDIEQQGVAGSKNPQGMNPEQLALQQEIEGMSQLR